MAEVPTMEVYLRGSQPPATVVINVEDYDPKVHRKMDEEDEPAGSRQGQGQAVRPDQSLPGQSLPGQSPGPGRPADKGPEPGGGPGKK